MGLVKQLRASSLVRDTRGLSTVEYVILLALIAALAVGTWKKFGDKINGYILESQGDIEHAMDDAP